MADDPAGAQPPPQAQMPQTRFVFVDGTLYEGEWADGRPHGNGTAFFPTGETYEGRVRRSRACPLPAKSYPARITRAQWVRGRRHAAGADAGTAWYADGSVYIGHWQDDEPHGSGSLYGPDGAVIDPGPWECGVSRNLPFPLEGKGRFEFPDGSVYDGDWLDGQFHGYGVFEFAAPGVAADGSQGAARDRYEGHFHRGVMHGAGAYTFSNGDVYRGTFVKGTPAGAACSYFWAREQQRYEGPWRDGGASGEGTLSFAHRLLDAPTGATPASSDGARASLVLRGTFRSGRPEGALELVHTDGGGGGSGRAYRGTWRGGHNPDTDVHSIPGLRQGSTARFAPAPAAAGASPSAAESAAATTTLPRGAGPKPTAHRQAAGSRVRRSQSMRTTEPRGRAAGVASPVVAAAAGPRTPPRTPKQAAAECPSPLPAHGAADAVRFEFQGATYEGEWRQWVPEGSGTIAYADGSTYEGEVAGLVPHGRGSLRHSSGVTVEGDWDHGLPAGRARALVPDARPSAPGVQATPPAIQLADGYQDVVEAE